MLNVGVHIGRLTFRVSFQSVEWPSHRGDDWGPFYRGGLPNACDPQGKTVGFDALTAGGPAAGNRLDAEFFRELGQEGGASDVACSLCDELLFQLRQCNDLKGNEPATVGLILDGIDLTQRTNRWLPWSGRKDCAPAVLTQFDRLGKKRHLEGFRIIGDREALCAYIASQQAVTTGDVVAIVSSRTTIWQVKSPRGALEPLGRASGIDDGLARIGNTAEKRDAAYRRFLHHLNHGDVAASAGDWREMAAWQQRELFPEVTKALSNASRDGQGPMRIWPVGEGASLLSGLDHILGGVSLQAWRSDALYWLAAGASALASRSAAGNAEE